VANSLAKAISDRDSGIIFDAESLTLGTFLDRWLGSRSSPDVILSVYSLERHDQLAGARAVNWERRVTAVGIPLSQLAIRPALIAAAVASSCRWVLFKPR
jgi:hypothetical protein